MNCLAATALAAALNCLAATALATEHASQLTPAEQRGRQIYQQGASAAREIAAVVAGNLLPTAMPCASCHGRDGNGKPEGGVQPPSLRPEVLTRPTQTRPAYDAARLRLAITMGIDPARRHLAPLMPRYQLMRTDADDLVAYLGHLGSIAEPGVTAAALRLGVAGAQRAVLQLWADDLNQRGGIYGRRIEIFDAQSTSTSSSQSNESITAFAILGDLGARLLEQAIVEEVPVLRVGTIAAETGPWVFELGASLDAEVTHLLEAAARLGALPVAISDARFAALCHAPQCLAAGSGVAPRASLVLDPNQMPPPGVLALVPSAIASAALANARANALVVARILPSDVDAATAARYTLDPDRLIPQWSALALANVVEEALRRVGRALTREAFVTALESSGNFNTDFSPPVSFSANDHHGIDAVRVWHFDFQQGSLSTLDDSTGPNTGPNIRPPL